MLTAGLHRPGDAAGRQLLEEAFGEAGALGKVGGAQQGLEEVTHSPPPVPSQPQSETLLRPLALLGVSRPI